MRFMWSILSAQTVSQGNYRKGCGGFTPAGGLCDVAVVSQQSMEMLEYPAGHSTS